MSVSFMTPAKALYKVVFEQTDDDDFPLRFVFAERYQHGSWSFKEYPERKEKQFWEDIDYLDTLKSYCPCL